MMAYHQTCVDIGKRRNYAVCIASCADCGKVGECNYSISPKFVCPCDNQTPISLGYDPCAECETRKSSYERQGSRSSDARSSAQNKSDTTGTTSKQTFWQWLLSLIGLGKKHEDNKRVGSGQRDRKSDPIPPIIKLEERQSAVKEKGVSGSINKQEETGDKQNLASPPAPVKEEGVEVKAGDSPSVKNKQRTSRKRKRSQSADSKSRNKYLGRPIEPSPPLKRRGSPLNTKKAIKEVKKSPPQTSSPVPTAELTTTQPPEENTKTDSYAESPKNKPQKESTQAATNQKPPISPIYSSEKYLKPYQPKETLCSKFTEKSGSNPHETDCLCRQKKADNKSSCGSESFEKSFRSMSCQPPCCVSHCACPCPQVPCCSPRPCCEPSITSLMRKRCPSPSKLSKKRSNSCSSPRCINDCTAVYKKEKQRRSQNGSQASSTSPGKCCKCSPGRCSKEIPSSPRESLKHQCCTQKPPECCGSPKMCANICQPPSSFKPIILPPAAGSYGNCPITCMRPCCVPLPATPFSNCCPPTKPKCSSPNCTTSPKARTATFIPRTSNKWPPLCSTFCSPNSLKSYARSKDGDAYCKFLMSRYNVSVPDYPPLCPMTLSGCSPIQQVSHVTPDQKRPCYTNKCGDQAATNATGNNTETSNDTALCGEQNEQKDSVLYNMSPSRKQPVSSFRLPTRTPIECIREQGPRSPVREYTSKLGLPNKLPKHKSPPVEVSEEPQEKSDEKPVETKRKSKSPKKKKKSSKDDQPQEENADFEEIQKQNKSDNKTTSDSGTAIHKTNHVQQSSFPSGQSPRVHRVAYTRRVSSKRASPIKEFTTRSTNERINKGGSSFYRNFLDISPRMHISKRSADSMKYREIDDDLMHSPNFSKRSAMASSPLQYHRSHSISPLPVSKISVPCSLIPSKPHISKHSPLASMKSLLQKDPPVSKPQTPRRSENLSVMYKERSFFIESNNGQSSSSKRTRKSYSPHLVKWGSPTEQIPVKKSPKSASPKAAKYAYYIDDSVERKSYLGRQAIPLKVSHSPKRSRSASPHEKRSKLIFEHDCQDDCIASKSESPRNKIRALSSEMNALREEIVALLNDSQDSLPDDDSLKTDTTVCIGDILPPVVPKYNLIDNTDDKSPKSERTNAVVCQEERQIKIKESLMPQCREYDGSSSVDGILIIGDTKKRQEKRIRTCTPCGSSVDPITYDAVGESCVDPANFHSDGSIQLCHFHTNSTAHDYSNNHYGVGAHTSSSVDSNVITNDILVGSTNNVSNNFDEGGSNDTLVDGSDAENKNDTLSNEHGESVTDSDQVLSSKDEVLNTSVSIRSLVNKVCDEICNNYYGVGYYTSSSVDGDIPTQKQSTVGDGVTSNENNAKQADNNSNNNTEGDNGRDTSVEGNGEAVDENYSYDSVRNIEVMSQKNENEESSAVGKESEPIGQTKMVKAETLENLPVTNNCCGEIKVDTPASGIVSKDYEEETSDVAVKKLDCGASPRSAPKRSLLQELLSNSGVRWQKVGPATETDIRIMRIAKAALMTTSNDQAETPPYIGMLKSEEESREGFRDLGSYLLRPKEKEGEEQSVLSRLKDL